MALGLLGGRSQPGAPVDEIYQRIQTLVQRFETQFGASNCQTLTGCHLGTEEGQTSYRGTNQKEKCLDYVAQATRMVLELAGS
jgi:hypothetical protein